MHHGRAHEDGDEKDDPPQEGDDEEEDGEVAEGSNTPEIVRADLLFGIISLRSVPGQRKWHLQLDHLGLDIHHVEEVAVWFFHLLHDSFDLHWDHFLHHFRH